MPKKFSFRKWIRKILKPKKKDFNKLQKEKIIKENPKISFKKIDKI
jgi:hypothetical protein